MEACAGSETFVFTFCTFAGKSLVHYLPRAGPEALDRECRPMGLLAVGPKQGCVREHYCAIWLSTSVGNSYIMNPSKLPEGLLVTEFRQINSQRTDNPECQDMS